MADPNDYLKQYGLDKGPSILEQKAARINTKKIEKIDRMDPGQFDRDSVNLTYRDFAEKYGSEAASQRLGQEMSNAADTRLRLGGRTQGERIEDAPESLAKGAVGLVGGLAASALDFKVNFRGKDVFSTIPARDAILRGMNKFDESMNRRMHKAYRLQNEQVGVEGAAAAEANQEVSDRLVDQGVPGFLATGAREVLNAKDAVKSQFNNPEVLYSSLVEQVPSLGIGPMGKLAVSAKAIEASAAKIAAKQGISVNAAKEIAKTKLAERNMMIGTGLTEGGSAYGDVAGEVLQTSHKDLAKQYPEMAEALLSKDSEVADAARSEIASKAGANAMAITGALTGGITKLSSGFNVDPTGLERRVANHELGNRARSAFQEYAADIGKEAIEEGLQSASGAFGGNLGQMLAGKEDVDLAEDVGAAVGQGALAGGLMAAGAGAPTAFAGSSAEVMDGLAAGIQEVIAPAQQQRDQVANQHQAFADEIARQTAERDAATGQVSPLSQPAATDPILDPETQQVMGIQQPADGAQPISRVSALSNALNTLMTKPDLGERHKQVLSVFALRTARDLKQQAASLEAEADATTDLRKKEELMTRAMDAMKLLTHPEIASLEESVKNVPEADLNNQLQMVMDVLDDPSKEDPETRQIFEMSKEYILQNPALVSKPMAEALYSKLGKDPQAAQEMGFTPEHVESLGAAVAFHNMVEEDTKAKEWIKGKDSMTVASEIRELGFAAESGYKLSLKEYFNDISAALANGEAGTARQMMAQLQGFASHMQSKAKAFDAAATTQLNSGKNDPVDVNFSTRREEKLFANIFKDGGRNLIDQIHGDADTVARTFNTLIQAHPALANNFKELSLLGKPKWRSNDGSGSTQAPAATNTAPAPAPVAPPAAPVSTGVTEEQLVAEMQAKSARELRAIVESFKGKKVQDMSKEDDARLYYARKELDKRDTPPPAPKVAEVKTYKIDQYTYTLNPKSGQVQRIDSKKGPVEETTLKQIGKVLAAYARETGAKTADFNGHPYTQMFGKTFNVNNGNVVTDPRLVAEVTRKLETKDKAEAPVPTPAPTLSTADQITAGMQVIGDGIADSALLDLIGRFQNGTFTRFSTPASIEAAIQNPNYNVKADGTLLGVRNPQIGQWVGEAPVSKTETTVEPGDVPLTSASSGSSGKTEFKPKNEEQRVGIEKIQNFINGDVKQTGDIFVLEGKAGTGKTTIMQAALLPYMRKKGVVTISAISHKAKSVLEGKLTEMALDNNLSKQQVEATTIASLLAMELDPETGKFVPNKDPYAEKKVMSATLIVVDEASMINRETLEMIMREKPADTKVIFLGDIGQLAPIGNNNELSPVFTMAKAPRHKLLERVRQGEDSSILPYADNYWNNSQEDNPSRDPIDPADRVNTSEMEFLTGTSQLLKKYIKYFKQAVDKKLTNRIKIIAYNNKDGQAMAAANLRRLENRIREMLFGENPPMFAEGEQIIMNDNYKAKTNILDNSTELVVLKSRETEHQFEYRVGEKAESIALPGFVLTVANPVPGNNIDLPVLSKDLAVAKEFKEFMNRYAVAIRGLDRSEARQHWSEFYTLKNRLANVGYSYILTSHKAQGSTYDISVVLEDNFLSARAESPANRSRGIYTAITRASKRVVIVSELNQQQEQSAPVNAVDEPAPAPAPKKANGLVERMRTAAAGMSDNALNERINKLMEKRDRTKFDEATLQILNDEMTKREEAAVAEQAQEEEENAAPTPTKTVAELRAEADAINGDEASVDFENDGPVSVSKLQDALDMPRGEYFRAVNPSMKETAPTDDAAIAAELDDMEAPSDAKVIGKIGDNLEMKAAGNYLYAVNADGDVKGLLINTPSGSTFMVHPDNRSQGIGKALMRELLIRNPLAQSNGMSKAAIAVRDAVRKELRDELTNKPEEGSIRTVFKGLLDSITDGIAGLNQFYRGFKPKKNSQSLFHRFDDPLQKFADAFAAMRSGANDSQFREMFPLGERDRNLNAKQLGAIEELTTKLAPEIVDSLNKLLIQNIRYKGARGTGSSIAERFGRSPEDAAKEWSFTNRKTLHVLAQDDNGTTTYHPKIAQAMALSALNWLTHNLGNPDQFSKENNDLSAMFPDGVPDSLAEAAKTKHYYTQLVRQIASDLGNVLGVTASDEASRTFNDGMLKQLAVEILFALEDVGLVEIDPVTVELKVDSSEESADPNAEEEFEALKQVFYMVGVNKGEYQNDYTKNEYRSIVPVVNALETTSFFSKLVSPGGFKFPSIGEKLTSVSQRIRGVGNPTSEIQKQNMAVTQDVPFTINGTVLKLSDQLGERWKELVGYTPNIDPDTTNVVHLETLRGKNQGIEYAYRFMQDYREQVAAYAKANNMDPHDVLIHFSADVISNGRIMYNGANVQSSKYLREMLTPHKSTLDLSNKDHTDGMRIAVAQAMGIKTERATWDNVIKQLEKKFDTPEYKQLFEDLVALDAAGASTHDVAIADRVFDTMMNLGINTDRGIHALQAYALFDKAIKSGAATFETALAFEVDGVTDGPVNAMVHMGLWMMNPAMVRQLRQGGMIIGRKDIQSMNQMGTSIGDLYQNAANATMRDLPKALAKKSKDERIRTLAAMGLLEKISYATLSTDKNSVEGYAFTRKMPKHGVMGTSYGSGMRSILVEMRNEIVDAIYKEFTDSLVAGELLSEDTRDMLETIIGKGRIPTTLEGYKDFRFSKADLDRILYALMGKEGDPGIGRIMVNNIRTEMAPILASFDLLYKATGLQTAYLQKQFEQAYLKRHAVLVAKGKILKNEALSQREEERILNRFVNEQPILKTMIAQGQRQGVNIGQKGFDGKLWLNGTKNVERIRNGIKTHEIVRWNERVTSLNGRMPMDINATSFSMPGVRAAALFNIALGDASMMSQMFMENAMNMVNVYDGLEVSVTDIKNRGNQVNKAVWNGWQFDALGSAYDSIANSKINFNAFSHDELKNLASELRLVTAEELKVIEDFTPVLEKALESTRNGLKRKAMMSRAMKKAIRDHHVLTDHMAGSENGFVNDGIDFTDQAVDEAAFDDMVSKSLSARAQEYVRQEMALGKATTKVENDEQSEEQPTPATAAYNTISGEQVQTLVKGLKADKVTRFILDKLLPLLPSDLQIVHSSADVINAELAREGHVGVEVDGINTRAVIIGNKIYMTDIESADVVAHELVHAVSFGLVNTFFHGKKSTLTKAQQKAVMDLATLAKEFMNLNPGSNYENARGRLETMQELIRADFNSGNDARAVNEFMAYILTDASLRNVAANHVAPSLLVRITKKFLGMVRELMGLPNNTHMVSFFEATLGRTLTLIERSQAQAPMGVQQLFHALGDLGEAATTSNHQAHVAQVVRTLERILQTMPEQNMTVDQRVDAGLAQEAADLALDKFLGAGFKFNEQEQYAFRMVQQMMYGYINLNPLTLNSLQELFTAVTADIKWQDFLPDPNEEFVNDQDVSIATQMHDAVHNYVYTDKLDRTSQMANFLALMLVYEPMQKKLATLNPLKSEIDKKTMNGFLTSLFEKSMNKLANISQHVSPTMNQREVLNTLLDRLAKTQEKTAKRLEDGKNPYIERVEKAMQSGRTKTLSFLEQQNKKTKDSPKKLDKWLNTLTGLGQAALDDGHANAFGSAVVSWLNTIPLPEDLMKLGSELVGTTDESEAIDRHHALSKQEVSKVRQRIRKEGPASIRSMFTRELSKPEAKAMLRVMGDTDLQSLLGHFSAQDLKQMMTDSAFLDQKIAEWEGRLAGMPNEQIWLKEANHLATYMVHKTNNSNFLYRNAHAIAALATNGRKQSEDTVKTATQILDRLVTLYAVRQASNGDKLMVANLMDTEKQAMNRVMYLMKNLAENERGKPNQLNQKFNMWKGALPMEVDSRTELRLATAAEGEKLLKQGYYLVRNYIGDDADPFSGLAYYATAESADKSMFAAGGRATYTQGAMQTVQATVGGVDRLTGRTITSDVQTMVTNPKMVANITQLKSRYGASGTGRNMLPIRSANGAIIGYERVLDQGMIKNHLKIKEDLAESLGIWMGRQAEENLAAQFNSYFIDVLHDNWKEGVEAGRTNEFVAVNEAKDPVGKDIWGSVPREIQLLLMKKFNGRVMIRKTNIDNALGYRQASIADIFTGNTNLPKWLVNAMYKTAVAAFGKNAYKVLTNTERTWMGSVNHVKDAIVVRSGVVATANAVANQYQLLQTGVPPQQMIQMQAVKVKETLTYFKNEMRQAQLTVEALSEPNPQRRKLLEREEQRITDVNRSLSIWPLIAAGELQTIAEGLSEQDQYNLLADAEKWIKEKMEALPDALNTAAQYAVVAEDTALYKGLNRLIQMGDFIAKAVVYDHLLSKGAEHEAAIREVSETFVNYTRNAGRSRDALERLGATWFLNYKIRIQKVVLRNIRNNPFSFMAGGAAASLSGADSLWSSSGPNTRWGSAFGLGQFFRFHEMNFWRQLFD